MTTDRPESGGASFEEMPIEQHRRASLVLRAEDVREARAESMAAANKALTDALRITYVLVLVVMGAIGVMFLLSGYAQVNQAERGLKISFGRIVNRELEPGPHLALPVPIGEIISVPTSQRTVLVEKQFLPSGFDTSKPIEAQGGGPSLRPGTDGFLLTSDGSIVHASVSATYSITDPASYLENLVPEDQEKLVKSVVGQATVTAFANTSIDDVLARSANEAEGSGNSSIERRIREESQRAVDPLEVGISIDQISLRLVFVPSRVREEFVRVNEVDAQASRAMNDANTERDRRLNEVAGSAYEPLLDLTRAYEAAVDAGDSAKADAVLADIYRVLDGQLAGRDVTINGTKYAEVSLGGEASRAISEARRARTGLVDEARQRSLTFQAKLEQYRASPRVFLVREWTEALGRVIASPHVQTFVVAPDGGFEILLNNDPEIAREFQAAAMKRLTEETMRAKTKLNPNAF